MNALAGNELIDRPQLQAMITASDAQLANPFGKDAQLAAINSAREYRGDRMMPIAKPHRFLDGRHGPLVAARMRVLTRKTLGGMSTDLRSRVQSAQGVPVPGLYAAGEIAGFGGGGMHGYRSLEGTFLGGCLYSGRSAGRAAAADIA